MTIEGWGEGESSETSCRSLSNWSFYLSLGLPYILLLLDWSASRLVPFRRYTCPNHLNLLLLIAATICGFYFTPVRQKMIYNLILELLTLCCEACRYQPAASNWVLIISTRVYITDNWYLLHSINSYPLLNIDRGNAHRQVLRCHPKNILHSIIPVHGSPHCLSMESWCRAAIRVLPHHIS